MSRSLNDLHPTLVAVWQKAEAQWTVQYPNDPVPFLTYTNRPNEEQAALYASGRTVKGRILTNAKPGESPHNYLPSYAFDIAFKKGKALDWRPVLFERFADIAEKISNEVLWGGRFKSIVDRPHFELKNWKQLK
ncbi:M15 family metallopeptidase [Runella sp.]|uniref:M15 family metallopeptidase n=1 Tax=Runella sp. TaxID=1960881 RepID=UPI003D0F9D2A